MLTELGKVILGIGAVLVLAGVALIVAGRMGLPLGRLPGDIAYRGKHVSVFFPIGTSILLSILLSAVLYVIAHLRR